MKTLSKDARGFVDSVVSYLEDEKKSAAATRVRSFLSRVTAQAKREKMAHVETSVVLTAEEKMRVERLLGKLLGHAIEISYEIHPAIIAGMTIRVADWILDTSFAGQLTQIQEQLNA